MNDATPNSNPNGDLVVVLPGGTKLPLTRRSIETGEFWLLVAIIVGLFWLQALGKVPPELGSVMEVVTGLGGMWLRTHAKAVGGGQVIAVLQALPAAKTLPAPALIEAAVRAGAAMREAPADGVAKTAIPMTGDGVARSGALTALAIFALALSGCGTCVKENGRTVFYTPANVGHLEFKKTARATRLVMDQVDHAVVHKAVGSSVAGGAAGIGAGVATSGLLGIFR